jgi:S-methylmethionine-dependent homocysteine/selenocysteine methylase
VAYKEYIRIAPRDGPFDKQVSFLYFVTRPLDNHMTLPLQQSLSNRAPLILDGAMGTELRRRGVDTGLPLWSANALLANPEMVRQIHAEYLSAGADIITTNTFRTTRRTMRRSNLPDRSKQLTAMAVDLAKRAREEEDLKGKDPSRSLLAGSIAPLEDCYRPELVPSDSELRDEHEEHAERLAALGVDFMLLETMNTIREAYAACEAAQRTGKEVIVSFICRKDGTLYSGESLVDAVRTLGELHPVGFSLNCVSPRFLDSLVPAIRGLTSLPIAAYGNVGLPEDERQDEEFVVDIDSRDYARRAAMWHRAGAAIVGGCCGTTPAYIAEIAGTFHGKDHGPAQVR